MICKKSSSSLKKKSTWIFIVISLLLVSCSNRSVFHANSFTHGSNDLAQESISSNYCSSLSSISFQNQEDIPGEESVEEVETENEKEESALEYNGENDNSSQIEDTFFGQEERTKELEEYNIHNPSNIKQYHDNYSLFNTNSENTSCSKKYDKPNFLLQNYLNTNMMSSCEFDGEFYTESPVCCSSRLLKSFNYELTLKCQFFDCFKVYGFNSDKDEYFLEYETNWLSYCKLPPNYFYVIVAKLFGKHTNFVKIDDRISIDFDFDYYIDSDLNVLKIENEPLGQLARCQSFCIYDNKYYSTDGCFVSIQDKDFKTIETINLSAGHGNSFQVGDGHLAYISGWDDGKVYVFDLLNKRIVEEISLPSVGYTTVAVDENNNLFYIFEKRDCCSVYSFYDLIVYNYKENVIVGEYESDLFLYAQQSTIFFNNHFYFLAGFGEGWNNYFIELETDLSVSSTLVLNSLKHKEPEGIFCNGDDTLISFSDCSVYRINITK